MPPNIQAVMHTPTMTVSISFMLLWHNTTKTSLSSVCQLSKKKKKLLLGFWLCFTHDGDVPPTDSSLPSSSLHHFVVRSIIDFRLLSLKTFFFLLFWLLFLSFPILWSICPANPTAADPFTFWFSSHIQLSSHILGKLYLSEERRLGKN